MMSQIKQEMTDEFGGHFNYISSYEQLSSPPFFRPELMPPQIKQEVEEEVPPQPETVTVVKEPKKRGRPKKVREDNNGLTENGKSPEKKAKQESITDHLSVKKRRDRFNGMPEEEVIQRLLPDHVVPNLDILIIGINPGLFAAYVGHHYAGPGNHFWKCLYLSGLIPEPMNAYDDFKLLEYGIGFTNICARTTKGSADLKKQEIKEGGEILRHKLIKYKPKIAVFNGKGIYEVFSGHKNFCIGKQPDTVEGTNTVLYVMPSSSARCAQLPRAVDKVPFYLGLKKLRDYLKGELPTLDDSEVTFPNVDFKSKLEVKDDDREDLGITEDTTSSSECPGELTLEQIQMQAEFQEALSASAEGKDIPFENHRRKAPVAKLKEFMLHNLQSSESLDSSESENSCQAPGMYPYTPKEDYDSPHCLTLLGLNNGDSEVKQEKSFDVTDYPGVSASTATTTSTANGSSTEVKKEPSFNFSEYGGSSIMGTGSKHVKKEMGFGTACEFQSSSLLESQGVGVPHSSPYFSSMCHPPPPPHAPPYHTASAAVSGPYHTPSSAPPYHAPSSAPPYHPASGIPPYQPPSSTISQYPSSSTAPQYHPASNPPNTPQYTTLMQKRNSSSTAASGSMGYGPMSSGPGYMMNPGPASYIDPRLAQGSNSPYLHPHHQPSSSTAQNRLLHCGPGPHQYRHAGQAHSSSFAQNGSGPPNYQHYPHPNVSDVNSQSSFMNIS